PRERGIDDGGQRRARSAVALVERKVGVVIADLVAEQGVVPAQVAADGLGVGIEDHLVRIETMALFWFIRAVNTVAVQLPWLNVGEIAVPYLIGMFGKGNAVAFGRRFVRVEQAQFHFGGMLGKQGEIHARAVPGG